MGCFPTSRRLVEDATGRYESHLPGADEAEEVTSFAMLSLLTGAALLGLRPTRRVIPSTSELCETQSLRLVIQRALPSEDHHRL